MSRKTLHLSLFLTSQILLTTPDATIAEDSDLGLFFSKETMVETVTRHPKPLVNVAENIHIVSAAKIESMNAHTLYEVLNRVPGLFITYNGNDFGSDASLTIHGASSSDLHRVLVLLDGIRLNTTSNGKALLNGIPVAIVERLEIIKGPSSSTWGSAIGGVVNIITKKPVIDGSVRATVSASYGEGESRDLRTELYSGAGNLGSYLYLGNQHSDGLYNDRYFDNSQAYAKGVWQVFPGSTLTVSGGYLEPEWKAADWPPYDNRYLGDNTAGFATTNLHIKIDDHWKLNLETGISSNDFTSDTRVLGEGILGKPGDPFFAENWDEQKINIGGRLVYTHPQHIFVFGAEAVFEELDYSLSLGSLASSLYGIKSTYSAEQATKESYGIFLNDTVSFNSVSLIPGIRFDHDSISGDNISPSLGLVWKISENNRIRGTVSRGFSSPYLTTLKQSSPFFNPNEHLEPEEVVSYQAGMESTSIPFLLVKTTFFYHDIDNVWSFDPVARQFYNSIGSKRTGIELEIETTSWKGLSAGGSFSYTIDDPENLKSDDFYKVNIQMQYSNPGLFTCELFGTLSHWLDAEMYRGKDDTFIWDLNLSKTVAIGNTPIDLFFTVHNLTNAERYWSILYPNPERWVEGGLRFFF